VSKASKLASNEDAVVVNEISDDRDEFIFCLNEFNVSSTLPSFEQTVRSFLLSLIAFALKQLCFGPFEICDHPNGLTF
jgi:hypothetical protein